MRVGGVWVSAKVLSISRQLSVEMPRRAGLAFSRSALYSQEQLRDHSIGRRPPRPALVQLDGDGERDDRVGKHLAARLQQSAGVRVNAHRPVPVRVEWKNVPTRRAPCGPLGYRASFSPSTVAQGRRPLCRRCGIHQRVLLGAYEEAKASGSSGIRYEKRFQIRTWVKPSGTLSIFVYPRARKPGKGRMTVACQSGRMASLGLEGPQRGDVDGFTIDGILTALPSNMTTLPPAVSANRHILAPWRRSASPVSLCV